MAILPTAVPAATLNATPASLVPDYSAQITDLQNRVSALEAVLRIGAAGDVTIKCGSTLSIQVAMDATIKAGTMMNIQAGAVLNATSTGTFTAQAGATMTIRGTLVSIN